MVFLHFHLNLGQQPHCCMSNTPCLCSCGRFGINEVACYRNLVACQLPSLCCNGRLGINKAACYRNAVGLFRGQGCERSELPCLACDNKNLGRRPWSFYISSCTSGQPPGGCMHNTPSLCCNGRLGVIARMLSNAPEMTVGYK